MIVSQGRVTRSHFSGSLTPVSRSCCFCSRVFGTMYSSVRLSSAKSVIRACGYWATPRRSSSFKSGHAVPGSKPLPILAVSTMETRRRGVSSRERTVSSVSAFCVSKNHASSGERAASQARKSAVSQPTLPPPITTTFCPAVTLARRMSAAETTGMWHALGSSSRFGLEPVATTTAS